MIDQRWTYLMSRYASGSFTDAEQKEWENMVLSVERQDWFRQQLLEFMQQTPSQESTIEEDGTGKDWPGIFAEVFAADKQAANDQTPMPQLAIPAHRIHFLKTTWFRYAAAIILLFGIGAYFYTTTQKQSLPVTETKPAPVKNDILPGSDRAMLTLSNGEQVALNNTTAETITDGTLAIENYNGQLIYKKGDWVATNTMTTPKGGQYQLTLADGTKVWLNAASSITYPTAFPGKTREVSITGEAYFEVAKDKTKPFRVKTNSDDITVLGTAFNVNAYADEPVAKISLLEGAVRVNTVTLQPGQAFVNGKIIATNVQQDVAWKNGIFQFDSTDVPTVLRQLSRWYNIEIVYTGAIPTDLVDGKMGRNLNLSDILYFLNNVIGLKTRLKGNQLFVAAK